MEAKIGKIKQNKGDGLCIVKSDLGSFNSSDRWEISVGGEEQIPVNQKSNAAAVDSGHGQSLAGENGVFHSLRLPAAVTETPRFPPNPHFSGRKQKTKLAVLERLGI
ncbi:hypothetical protein CASFOL_038578 [Castilleja foliolosa]|uniref:Uncharacterized protein n=1 Tax=Castilleja foliolosa TaxID=1961234 RepID=A0ABD3BNE7_9LAMI